MRRFILAIAALVAFFIAGICHGQDPANVVRIQCGSSVGSGVYLGDRMILSCAHLFRGERTQQVSVTFPSGKSYFGSAVRIDQTWDQSAIELAKLPTESGARLATVNPKPGERLTSAGYDRGQTLRLRTGQLTQYLTARSGHPRDWFDMTSQVVGGCSGGPVFNARGEVIGNLWGSSHGSTVALMCGRTRRFLLPWNARLAAHWQRCAPRPTWGSSPGSVSPPIAQPPTPVPPEVQVPIPSPEIDISEIIEELKNDPEFIASIRGEDGQDGRDGIDGNDATIGEEQIQQIAAAIQASLQPIQVAAAGVNENGERVLFPIADVRLGETLVLPPATVHGLDHTGKLIDTEILPIGGTINIRAPGLVRVPKNGG